jgi:hypothetical protein
MNLDSEEKKPVILPTPTEKSLIEIPLVKYIKLII